MTNFFLLNTTLLNAKPLAPGLYQNLLSNGTTVGTPPDDSIRFNLFSLQRPDKKIITDQPRYDRPAQRLLDTANRPNEHGFSINSDYYGIKEITLNGVIYCESQDELEEFLDEIKKSLRPALGNLDIKQGDGSYRRFIATAKDFTDFRDKHYHITWCPYQVTFDVYNSFGQDIEYNSEEFLGVTQLVFSEQQVNIGNVETENFLMILIFSQAQNIVKFNLKNNTTEQEIEFLADINPGDVVYIDTKNKVIRLNSDRKRFSGDFPQLKSGANSYTITLTGDSCEYDLTSKHLNAYL